MSTVIIAFYDVNGAPLSSLVPTFASYKTFDGTPIVPAPPVTEVGGGLYAFVPAPFDLVETGVAYLLDGGALASPRYQSGGLGDEVAPGWKLLGQAVKRFLAPYLRDW